LYFVSTLLVRSLAVCVWVDNLS